jgi:hypothetical protein
LISFVSILTPNLIQANQFRLYNFFVFSVPRQPEINPVHSSLLAQRQAQQERDQQNTNIWYQRQFNPSLIGFDVVTRRLPQPVIMVPRLPPTMMDLSIFVLHPTDAVLSGAAGIPTTHQHATAEPQPVGASVDQIKKFSSVLAYVKDPDVPEQERERCTVCLVDFETGDDIRSLHCTHMFHVDCIDRWLVYNKKCPICRSKLFCYSQKNFFLSTTELFIESGNVYIETKRNVDPYIAFLMHPCVIVLARKSGLVLTSSSSL